MGFGFVALTGMLLGPVTIGRGLGAEGSMVPEPEPPVVVPTPVGGGGGWYGWRPKRAEEDGCDVPTDSVDAWLPCYAALERSGKRVRKYAWQAALDRRAAVERLRRFVALAGSDNPHEARSAADHVVRMLRDPGLLDDLAAYLESRGGAGVDEDGRDVSAVLALLAAAPADRTPEAVLEVAADARERAEETQEAREDAALDAISAPPGPSVVASPSAESAPSTGRLVTVGLGAVLGWVVAGPVGALVGGAVGAAVGATVKVGRRPDLSARRRRGRRAPRKKPRT